MLFSLYLRISYPLWEMCGVGSQGPVVVQRCQAMSTHKTHDVRMSAAQGRGGRSVVWGRGLLPSTQHYYFNPISIKNRI